MKKIIALTCALMLSAGLLTACGSKADASAVNTVILKEAGDKLINIYTLLAVDPDAPFTDADGNAVGGVKINTAGAAALIDWFLSEEYPPFRAQTAGAGAEYRKPRL